MENLRRYKLKKDKLYELINSEECKNMTVKQFLEYIKQQRKIKTQMIDHDREEMEVR